MSLRPCKPSSQACIPTCLVGHAAEGQRIPTPREVCLVLCMVTQDLQYQFPNSCSNKLSGMKQHRLILLCLLRSELRNMSQWTKSGYQQGCWFLLQNLGENPVSRGGLNSWLMAPSSVFSASNGQCIADTLLPVFHL